MGFCRPESLDDIQQSWCSQPEETKDPSLPSQSDVTLEGGNYQSESSKKFEAAELMPIIHDGKLIETFIHQCWLKTMCSFNQFNERYDGNYM